MKRLTQVSVRVLLASLMLMSALPALGQVGQEPVEPAPQSASWLGFVLALFLGAAIAMGCLMSPKRTHQD